MPNLEPIDEKDLDLESKFKTEEATEKEVEQKPVAVEKKIPPEISSAEKEDIYAKILAKVQGPTSVATSGEEIKTDAASVYRKTDAESQIQNLVDLAFAKGVVHAVKVARHLEDNYVLDMFHDRMLADELHEALIQKELIKET